MIYGKLEIPGVGFVNVTDSNTLKIAEEFMDLIQRRVEDLKESKPPDCICGHRYDRHEQIGENNFGQCLLICECKRYQIYYNKDVDQVSICLCGHRGNKHEVKDGVLGPCNIVPCGCKIFRFSHTAIREKNKNE